jgi:hypothetical protein
LLFQQHTDLIEIIVSGLNLDAEKLHLDSDPWWQMFAENFKLSKIPSPKELLKYLFAAYSGTFPLDLSD